MKKQYGYVTFTDGIVNPGTKLEGQIIVYPNIEDSLRFTELEDEKTISLVSYEKSQGITDSEYYGYYNMHVCNEIVVEKNYEYDEVVDIMLNGGKNEISMGKFIRSFKLSDADKERFASKDITTWKAIQYYQNDDRSIFKESEKQLVKKYGKYNNKRCEGE